MQKGVLSNFIGIIAILFVIIVLVFSLTLTEKQKTLSYNKQIIETKKITQNAVLLLDKIMNDAIADSAFANNCTEVFDKNAIPLGIKQTISSYFDTAAKEFQPDCIITVDSITQGTGQNKYITSFSVRCSQSVLEEFSVVYREEKNFKRDANVTTALVNNNNECTVEIRDGQALELKKTKIF